jgi:NADH-quinone oxidoreductase subunit N
MTVGNLVALAQKDIKRILAYSSIAHAGYILVAILAHAKNPQEVGWGTLAIYLLSYSLMTIGAFIVISLGAKGGKEGTRLQHLNGLWQRSPWAAIALVVFMASLIGIPPTAGFLAKLQIFQDAVSSGLWPLAIGLAVNSAISVYYYLGIAMAAFVNDQTDEDVPTKRFSPSVGFATGICAAGVFLVTIFFAPISNALFGPDGTVVRDQIVHTGSGDKVGIR